MITRKVGARGQVTIPKQIREKENLKEGDKVRFREEDGEVVLMKVYSKEELKKAYTERAEEDRKLAEEWSRASTEANKHI